MQETVPSVRKFLSVLTNPLGLARLVTGLSWNTTLVPQKVPTSKEPLPTRRTTRVSLAISERGGWRRASPMLTKIRCGTVRVLNIINAIDPDYHECGDDYEATLRSAYRCGLNEAFRDNTNLAFPPTRFEEIGP
jgi:hypothetical protein